MWYSGQITEAQRIVGFVFMAGEEHRSDIDRVQIVVFMYRSITVHSRTDIFLMVHSPDNTKERYWM